jgi:hypothetical protein
MDGDIDYSRYSRADLEEAITRIDRSKFPINYQNLHRELDTRPPEPARETRPPSAALLIVCYTAAVLVLNAVLNLFLSAALFVIYHDNAPSDFGEMATHLKEGIFLVLVVGAYFHLARSFRGQFAKTAVGVAFALSVFNLLAARLPRFQTTVSPVTAFLGMLALMLLAAGVGRALSALFGSVGAPSNNRWRGP